MPTALRIIVYPIFAIVCFFIFFLLLFPFDSVKVRIEVEAEKGLGAQYDVRIGEMSLAPLTGVSMQNVQIVEKGGKRQSLFKLDSAKIHVDVLPLIWGAIKLGYDLKSDGGRMYGRLSRSGDQINIEADLKNVNAAVVPWTKVKWGVGLSSDIDGKIDMELFPRAPLSNNGSIQLQIQNLKLDKVDIKGILTLPAVSLATPEGKSKVDVRMNRGSVEIRSLDLKGGDATLGLGGKIYLAQRVSNFRFNIRGKMGFSEEIGKEIPFLDLPFIQKQKDPDGFYPITMTGQIRRPNIRVGSFKVPI